MLIRSQDKETLINFNNSIVIDIMDNIEGGSEDGLLIFMR